MNNFENLTKEIIEEQIPTPKGMWGAGLGPLVGKGGRAVRWINTAAQKLGLPPDLFRDITYRIDKQYYVNPRLSGDAFVKFPGRALQKFQGWVKDHTPPGYEERFERREAVVFKLTKEQTAMVKKYIPTGVGINENSSPEVEVTIENDFPVINVIPGDQIIFKSKEGKQIPATVVQPQSTGRIQVKLVKGPFISISPKQIIKTVKSVFDSSTSTGTTSPTTGKAVGEAVEKDNTDPEKNEKLARFVLGVADSAVEEAMFEKLAGVNLKDRAREFSRDTHDWDEPTKPMNLKGSEDPHGIFDSEGKIYVDQWYNFLNGFNQMFTRMQRYGYGDGVTTYEIVTRAIFSDSIRRFSVRHIVAAQKNTSEGFLEKVHNQVMIPGFVAQGVLAYLTQDQYKRVSEPAYLRALKGVGREIYSAGKAVPRPTL